MKLRFLLDTNICIYLIKRNPEKVMSRLEGCNVGEVAMSAITYAELKHGVLCAADPVEAQRQLDMIVSVIPIMPFDSEAAAAYGPIRFSGKPGRKDLMDKLIAAHAVALDAILVTNNTADFEKYPGIRISNWAE